MRLGSALARRGLTPAAIKLEITEDSVVDAHSGGRAVLQSLAEDGFHVAVDDFGTGYSSLGYLLDLHVAEVKIDKSLVLPLDTDPRCRIVIESVLMLAHGLGLTVVAEGIENVQVLSMLRTMGLRRGSGLPSQPPVDAPGLRGLVCPAQPPVDIDPGGVTTRDTPPGSRGVNAHGSPASPLNWLGQESRSTSS